MNKRKNEMNKGKALILIHNLHQPDTFFNIGAGYLVSVLKQYGAEVDVFDMAIEDLNEDQLADYLQDNNDYDIIGLGFLSARFRETVEPLCKVINKYKNNALLVLGGNGASAIPRYTLEKTQADIICVGESEESIVEVLNCKVNGGNFTDIKGIVYRKGNEIIINPRRNPVANLDSIPFPSWSDFNMQKYTSNIKLAGMTEKDKCFPITTSRGCSNRCTFCYRMERGLRGRSVSNIIQEIFYLNKEFGITYFFMFDELFIYSRKKIFEFAEKLKQNNLHISYNCNCRVDLFDEEIAKCLQDSGCLFLNVGFENQSQVVLDEMKKNATVVQNRKVAEICKKIGLGMGLNTIWAMPFDDEETLKANKEFIMEFNLYDQLRTVRPVSPFPGSELFWNSIANGQLKDEDDFFNKFKNSDLITVNYTNLPTEKCYELLFETNKELIIDHYQHTNKDMVAANKLIQDFKELYSGKDMKFRGAKSDTTNEDKRKIIR
jgi:radical SAM superfamily enzyme YgiQ (UPF0313 family)